jgi:hypothetical protein
VRLDGGTLVAREPLGLDGQVARVPQPAEIRLRGVELDAARPPGCQELLAGDERLAFLPASAPISRRVIRDRPLRLISLAKIAGRGESSPGLDRRQKSRPRSRAGIESGRCK